MVELNRTGANEAQPTKYRPALDGVRAICIVLTMMNHIHGWPRYVFVNFGVDIFFALSGWLITWLMISGKEINKYSLQSFYIRRIFRIVPLYYTTILIYLPAAVLMHKNTADILLLTFNPEYRLSSHDVLIGQAWTLGIEEKFYILWPAALLLFLKRPPLAFGLAILASLAFMVLGHFEGQIVRGYLGLGAGAALAFSAQRHPSFAKILSHANVAEVCAFLLIIVYCLKIYFIDAWIWNVIIAAISAFGIANLWLRPAGALSRALSARPLPFLGTLTYAVYLTHVLALNVCKVVFVKIGIPPNPLLLLIVGYGASLCLAWPLHRFIEIPAIAFGRRLASRQADRRLAVGT